MHNFDLEMISHMMRRAKENKKGFFLYSDPVSNTYFNSDN